MARTPYKMKGNPMQRNYGIGASPVMKDEKDKKVEEEKVENDIKYGQMNDEGTQIINKKGDWATGANFASVYNEAKEAGVLSGGPDPQ